MYSSPISIRTYFLIQPINCPQLLCATITNLENQQHVFKKNKKKPKNPFFPT